MNPMRRTFLTVVFLTSQLLLSQVVLARDASAAHGRTNSCIFEAYPGGPILNMNELLGVSEQIIGPIVCADESKRFVLSPGEFAVVVLRWFAGPDCGSECNYPDGYEALGTPLEDALAKFESVRIVIDDDRQYAYPAADVLLLLDLGGGWTQVTFLPKLPPQPVGVHNLKYYWKVSQRLCGPDLCLEGESLFPDWYHGGELEFEVAQH
jgi:hypothetical protein